MSRSSRLALGTVQFGLDYGVANQTGQVSLAEAARILDVALAAGLDTLDTAIGYGDSEARLGEIGVVGWRIVTKLPELPDVVDDVAGWVESSAVESLDRLGVQRLHGVLLHRPGDLLGPRGAALKAGLLQTREQGLADKIGVSVYGPNALEALWDDGFDLIQIPFNVFDRSLVSSGWLERLVAAGVEVHTRSAFLQGLLLMEEWPGYFDPWAENREAWVAHCAGTSKLEASLGFALSQPGINRVVVGVDSADQLTEILEAADQTAPILPDTLACEDSGLIDPSRWEIA